jgi:type 1 glutamine amidotransferase
MNRRELLRTTGTAAVALGFAPFPLGWTGAADAPKRRILMYTKSEGYQHEVVTRKNGALSLAERIVTDLGSKNNFDVTCTKDGRDFLNEDLNKFDAFLFETQGDLSREGVDKEPPMPPEAKAAFLKAIAGGKGFVGCHCASDTFHSPGDRAKGQDAEHLDPYIVMLGGEFIRHGAQQKAWMRVVDQKFPGLTSLKDFELEEEWYSLKNFAPDLHVILVQDTEGMKGADYARPSFPATWARKHHKGRVFYTSMGHRSDVWTNPTFHEVLLGGLAWAMGNVSAAIPPNLEQVTPKAGELPDLGKK